MFCRLRRQNIGKMCGGCGAAMGPGVEKPQATVTIAFGENALGARDGRGRRRIVGRLSESISVGRFTTRRVVRRLAVHGNGRTERGNGQPGRNGRPDVLPPAAAKHRGNGRGMWRGHGSWGRETPGYGNNRLRRKRAGGAGREGAVTNSRSTSFLPACLRPGGFAALR